MVIEMVTQKVKQIIVQKKQNRLCLWRIRFRYKISPEMSDVCVYYFGGSNKSRGNYQKNPDFLKVKVLAISIIPLYSYYIKKTK